MTESGLDGMFQPDDLIKIANMKMPFGKYQGRALIDLPEPYVIWFHNKGLPKGELGRLMAQLYDIKVNGLEYLFGPLRNKSIDALQNPATPTKKVRSLKSYRD